MSFSTIEDFINSDLEKLKSHLNKNQLAFVHAVENIIICMSICWKMVKTCH